MIETTDYQIIQKKISYSKRKGMNEKIIECIQSGNNDFTKEEIFNFYSGKGGLHSLKQKDFENFSELSKAKREIEQGQFFTPHEICKKMVALIHPEPTELIMEMCCGIGNFINYLPNKCNVFGFDIDENAIKVAKHLYPDAHIKKCDIRNYQPDYLFDYVIGNPPFNLDLDGALSQFYYINKSYYLLKPTGILLFIAPQSFLKDEFWEKTRVSTINKDFSFIGQAKLDDHAFSYLGAKDFQTKVMVFMRYSQHIELKEFDADEFITFEELKSRIDSAKQIREDLKYKILWETQHITQDEELKYQYAINKYLYEIKTHRNLQKNYQKSLALITKLINQRPPEDCSHEEFNEWKKSKLTYPKVLGILKTRIKNQNNKPRKEIALVRTRYGFKLKAYAPHLLNHVDRKYTSIIDLIAHFAQLPSSPYMNAKIELQYQSAIKTIKKKAKEYKIQSQLYREMKQQPELEKQINTLSFVNKEMETCHFTDLQKNDMGLIFQKKYPLLNWQQGSGKTAVAYHFAKHQLDHHRAKNVIVIAPAIAVNLTWEPFLKRNRTPYRLINEYYDLEDIDCGMFLLISISLLDKLKRHLKQFMKINSNKICLIFDESDEITNPNAQRTELTKAIFRRAMYKILATGTTTRNNINELYSQLELLYNNSVNMICYCSEVYFENKDKEILREINDYYARPFPSFRGHVLFKHCFCPSKTTVFGIEKQNQDIYNKDALRELIGKTILTRKFREFAGEKYQIKNHSILPSAGENAVYVKILEEFIEICNIYFRSTGDEKKDAMLKMIRQIQLLIKACSVPNLMPGYKGAFFPRKAHYIEQLINELNEKVAIGCTTLDSLYMYESYLSSVFKRPLFIIKGDVSFKKRERIINQFENTANGILLTTQQSLKSSANIPSCNEVILESMQWNVPKMEQFYFRCIRLDSKENTNVHFVTYKNSIEQNLLALVLTKERLNEFIKNGEIKEQSEIFDEFDVSSSLIESLLRREQDEEGRFHISWGNQKIS